MAVGQVENGECRFCDAQWGAGYVLEAFNSIPIRNVHPDSIIALCGKRILSFRLGQDDKAGRIRLLGPFGFNVQ